MDQKIEAVLDSYHERLRRETETDTKPLHHEDGKPRELEEWLDERLLAVGPDTGQLINVLARSLRAPNILEIGTSYGYSAIWLAEAARAAGGRLITIEQKSYKSNYAREMAIRAELSAYIDFKVGDAVKVIPELPLQFDFVLLDLWKDLYVPCLEAFYPKLNPGAIIVADNMIYPSVQAMKHYADAVRAKPGVRSLLVPVGQGLEISRFRAEF